jgi:diguanylate cyclase (GGDEF)-like protein
VARTVIFFLAAAALAATAPQAARAACVGNQTGALAQLESLAFNDPAKALPQVAAALTKSTDQRERVGLHAIAADASRQLGLSRQSITYADAGLALLAPNDLSDVATRMRTVRALVSTNVGGIDAAVVDLTRIVDAVRDRPLVLGCVLRDRGWLHYRAGNTEQALDDMVHAYNLLRKHASREEATVAAGRLSMAYYSVRDYAQALTLVDESIDFFRAGRAQVRLATGLDRRAAILRSAGRYDEALAAGNEALRIHTTIRDRVGTGLSQMRLCGIEIARNELAAARTWCDRAEGTLSGTSGMDDNDYRSLAALRGRLLIAEGDSRAAVLQLDRAISPGGAQPADDISELHELRARAYAEIGNYPAAFADQSEHLRRVREQAALDRIREMAQLRVQFQMDQEKQKIALLEKDKLLTEERLINQARVTRLVAIAGLTGAGVALALAYALWSNRRHRAQLVTLAERDELTGLPNRRTIVRRAVAALTHSRQSDQPLTIGLIDLDHFKNVNDRYGHAVGDELLQRFASVADARMGACGALIGRFGGEEFLLVFENMATSQARVQAEGLCQAMRSCAVTCGNDVVAVTLSIGLAACESGDASFDQIVRRADTALYSAKSLGRNRVEIYSSEHHAAFGLVTTGSRARHASAS